ncbi:methyltransferase RsmF C-terminal domain-like protein [Calditerrivibrio sp.]|uniref:methyltransferase RsmF C-terminal domain-like protein n=1 Tax=Calditerrivibrio sp. TaxID=2792612 RepID=UPI003D101F1A
MNKEFIRKYRDLFGNESDDFFASLLKKRKRYFRLNKARDVDYLKELNSYKISATDIPNIFSYDEPNEIITNTISFLTGGIYIQNPSSVIPPMILSKLLGNKGIVIDVAAAPGGKTTALSEFSNRNMTIIANEPSSSRLKSLNFNIEKYGAWNINTISYDGRILHKKLPQIFDGILLDAPCSNENKIGYNDEVNKNWSIDLLNKMKKLQKEIILSSLQLLKPGGFLIYSTCTFSIEENEKNVEEILKENSDVELIDINENRFTKGISGNISIDDKVIRVLPHKSEYDGFFIAGLKKKGELIIDDKHEKNIEETKINRFFPGHTFEGAFKSIDGLVFFQKENRVIEKIKFNKTGIKAGKIVKNELELSSQFLWEFGKFFNEDKKIYIEREIAIEFLSGFDINMEVDRDKNALFYENIPVGIVKNLGGVLKNKLDRYFLYGRGI